MAKKRRKKRAKKRAGRRKKRKTRRSGGHIPLKILEKRAGKLLRIVHKRGGSPK